MAEKKGRAYPQGLLHQKIKKAEIFIVQRIPAFLFLLKFYWVCFSFEDSHRNSP